MAIDLYGIKYEECCAGRRAFLIAVLNKHKEDSGE